MVERIKALSAVVDLFVIAEEGFVGVEALLPLVQVCEGRVSERVEARERESSFAFLCLFFCLHVCRCPLTVSVFLSLGLRSCSLLSQRYSKTRVWMSAVVCVSGWVGVVVSLLCVCLSHLCPCLSFSVSLPRSRSRFLSVSLSISLAPTIPISVQRLNPTSCSERNCWKKPFFGGTWCLCARISVACHGSHLLNLSFSLSLSLSLSLALLLRTHFCGYHGSHLLNDARANITRTCSLVHPDVILYMHAYIHI
jgi:hypothetical protein